MGFLTSIFERRTLDEASAWALITNALRGIGGGSVTPTNAMQLATVFACTRVVSEGVAMLPLVLFEQNGRMRQRAKSHPVYSLLHDLPNPEMTSVDVRAAMMGHLSSWGNAYAQIVFDRAGRRRELWPLRPDRMEVVRDPADNLLYKYQPLNGDTEYFQRWEIMHVRGLSFDGLIGYSPISQARKTFERKQRMEEYEASFWENSARPDFVLKTPAKLSDKAYSKLLDAWEKRFKGPGQSGRTAILEEGLDVATIGIPQTDAQFLESMKFSRQEIAAMYRVPLHMINDLDRATFSNIEEQGQEFVVYTLGIWLKAWEEAIYRDLLTPAERNRYYARHMVQGLLRGNHATRSQFYTSLWNVGAMSINEMRDLEDMNPIPDGDSYFVPLNMVSLDAALNEPPAAETQPDSQTDSQAIRAAYEIAFQPLFDDAARRAVNRIARDVKMQGSKALRHGGVDGFIGWLDGYIADVDRAISSTFQASVQGLAEMCVPDPSLAMRQLDATARKFSLVLGMKCAEMMLDDALEPEQRVELIAQMIENGSGALADEVMAVAKGDANE